MYELLFFLLGLAFGSFGSVLVVRLPAGRHICGRSGCPRCEKVLSPFEIIPLLSFLAQRGKCRGCGSFIGWLYPLLELATGALFIAAWLHHQTVISAVLLGLVLWLLLLIAVMDFRTQCISDVVNFPLLILSIAYGFSLGRYDIGGMLLGGGFFGGLWLVSHGKWIGSGGVILPLGIGALLGGFGMMLACLFITYILGALF